MPSSEHTRSATVGEPAILSQAHAYTVRRLLGGAFIFLAAGAGVGATAGAADSAFLPTHIQLGPHQADVTLPFDGKSTLDLGPLGYADKSLGLPLNAGVKVTVKGIPNPENHNPANSAANILGEYEELLQNPKHIESSANSAVISRAWHDTVEGGVIGGAIGAGLFARRRHRREADHQKIRADIQAVYDSALEPNQKRRLIAQLAPQKPTHRAKSVAIATTIALTACSSDMPSPPRPMEAIDHALDDTPMQGYALHGALLQIAVDNLAPPVIRFINGTQRFYRQEVKAFQQTFQDKFGASKLEDEGILWVQGLSDNHCNIGEDSVHGAVAKAFDVSLTIDDGDMAMAGSPAEEECIAAEADAIIPHNPEAVVAGNHDSPTIESYARKHGMIVLDNDMLTQVGKFKLLGEADVNQSTPYTPIHLRATETVEAEADNIKKAACNTHPDIIVGHEQSEVMPAAVAGCAPEVRFGHDHQFHPPTVVNARTGTYTMDPGTAGGAKPNALTVGPLQMDATETVCGYSNDTLRLIGCYIITSKMDGTVSISDFQPMPAVSSAPVSDNH